MNDKYISAVHFVIDKCKDPYKLGSIKLNKILLFTDGILLMKTNKTLTGDTYIKKQRGPIPKNISAILNKLESENLISIRKGNYNTKLFFSLKEPYISNLTSVEIDVLLSITMDIYNNYKAKEISDITHKNKLWKLLDLDEEIDLYSYFIAKPSEISKEDVNWALNIW